jgi:hypothetical protein
MFKNIKKTKILLAGGLSLPLLLNFAWSNMDSLQQPQYLFKMLESGGYISLQMSHGLASINGEGLFLSAAHLFITIYFI